jgi:hypothetical protein
MYDGISICNVWNNGGVYDTIQRNMLPSEQKIAYSLLCFRDQTPNSYLTQLWIFIHHAYVSIHLITILIQKNFLCVIQFQFLFVHFSLHYNIQSTTVMQWNKQPATHKHAPRPCNFVSKMFLRPKSFKNLPIPTPTQIHARNIDKPERIIRQVRRKFAVMKPSMWMIFHWSNSG